jgi:hypothetical protein
MITDIPARTPTQRKQEFIELFNRLSPAEQADSVRRMEARVAKSHGTATAEQLALVEDTDRQTDALRKAGV